MKKLNIYLMLLLFATGAMMTSCGGDPEEETKEGKEDVYEAYEGTIKVEIEGDIEVIRNSGTAVVYIDGIEVTDFFEKEGKLVAELSNWHGSEPIYFKVWLTAQGKKYKVSCFHGNKKLNKKDLYTEVNADGTSYVKFEYPGDNG